MAETTYVVLQELSSAAEGDDEGNAPETLTYVPLGTVEASSTPQARRRAAQQLPDAEVDRGVMLVAISARAWKSGRGQEKAEMERRFRSS
jgi:hypothetical protein